MPNLRESRPDERETCLGFPLYFDACETLLCAGSAIKLGTKKTRVPGTRGSHDFRTVLPSLWQLTSVVTGLAIGEVQGTTSRHPIRG